MIFRPEYETRAADSFFFGSTVKASAHPCLESEAIRSFWNGFCCGSSELEIISETNDFILSAGNAQRPSAEGFLYAVNVEKNGFCIVSESRNGLIKGFMTLLQQIKPIKLTDGESLFAIPCGLFRENPKIKNQMVHFCVFPETELWEIERFIRFSAALKYSHLVIEFWGMLKYDCMKELSWLNAFTKEQIRPLIKTANELGLEIIPMFNHWGHAAASRAMHGKHVVLDQNPKLALLFGEDGWTWNITNPEVKTLLGKIRGELIELCGGGGYFHLGCDEPYNFPITCENYTVLTDYIGEITEELSKIGRRPIIWGDMLISKHSEFNPENRYIASCENIEIEKCLLTHLDKRAVIADWQYGAKVPPVETALIFNQAGFDTLLCPWDRTEGYSVSPCVRTARDYRLFGIMHTTWNTLSKGMPEVVRAAFIAWNAPEIPELMTGELATECAGLMRKVFPVNGDYKKAGWAKNQISDIT